MTDPFIQLRAVSRVYRRGSHDVHALRDLDLDLAPHAFTVVVGRSGSGKSTLLHALAAMEQPTSGAIRVGDWDVTNLDRRTRAKYRREAVGMIFQQFNLIPAMSALENVTLPLVLAGVRAAERDRRARTVLEEVGLGHRLDHRPDELSGGEQQRVAVARALVHDPPLLLADEPTGNLDTGTAAEIVALLDAIHRQGRSVLVVTHNLAEFERIADRVVRLNDGAVVEDRALTSSTA